MGRAVAQLRTDMWGDEDWRSLTPGAQWLYEYLLVAPSLTHVGVADWRPPRIARLARGLSADQVVKYAAELSRTRFVVVDDDTEEILVRSFLRHDGLLLNPNMWKSVGQKFAEVASEKIRRAVATEFARLRSENPDGMVSPNGKVAFPWSSPYLRTLAQSVENPSGSPIDTPSAATETPSDRGSYRGSPPTPAPTPTTEASLPGGEDEPKGREIKLPKDWAPTSAHLERARADHLDIAEEAERFRLHAETYDRRAVSWNAAFTTWLKKAKPSPALTGAPKKRFTAHAD